MRAIDADALLEYLQILPIDLGYREVEEIEEYVKGMPTIEERKKGKWITHFYAFGEDRYECDQCRNTALHLYDFCPNCGSDMRGEQE